MRPECFIARGYHIGMTGKQQTRKPFAITGIEIVDIGCALGLENLALCDKARCIENALQEIKRAALLRCDGRAAHQGLRQCDGVAGIHCHCPVPLCSINRAAIH